MNLLWLRPLTSENGWSPDERRIRDYVDAPGGISESAASLAGKLGISRRRCRRVLEHLVEQGVLRRHDFADIDPVYVRFPTL
jgi:predicted ArsR family transcriptional regulator